MRKTIVLAAMTAIMALMLAATPALADDFDRNDFCDFFDCNNHHNNFNDGFGSQDFEQDADSGDVDQSFDVTGGGDNSNQTVGLQGGANTGNAQNQIGITQFGQDGDFNDFDPNRNFFHNDGFFNDFNNNRFDGNGGDFEFDDVGSSIEVSPTNTTTSDQQVNQAASAFGK